MDEDNPARLVDAFVDELDLGVLGFEVVPAATGRPAYHPATLLKLYIYGYLNRGPSSRRLEREAGRNVELMWLRFEMIISPDQLLGDRKPRDHLRPGRRAAGGQLLEPRSALLFQQLEHSVDLAKFLHPACSVSPWPRAGSLRPSLARRA